MEILTIHISFRVLYHQLCHTYDSIKKDQLNADLCTTLQLLHGALSQFTCSEMR